MPRYRVTETIEYEVEAANEDTAELDFLNMTDEERNRALICISDRTVEPLDE